MSMGMTFVEVQQFVGTLRLPGFFLHAQEHATGQIFFTLYHKDQVNADYNPAEKATGANSVLVDVMASSEGCYLSELCPGLICKRIFETALHLLQHELEETFVTVQDSYRPHIRERIYDPHPENALREARIFAKTEKKNDSL